MLLVLRRNHDLEEEMERTVIVPMGELCLKWRENTLIKAFG